MNDSTTDLQQFLASCQALQDVDGPENPKHEEYINKFLRNPDSFHHVKAIFENQAEPTLKLMTIEFLSKSLTKRTTAGTLEFESRYRSIEDIEKPENQYLRSILDYFVYYLSVRKMSDPPFIVNSICDFYGNLIKFMISQSLPVPPIEELQNVFFSANATPDDYLVGLKLMNFCLTNLLINSHHYGYFKFRKMIYAFQSKCLIDILNATRHTLKTVSLMAFSQNPHPRTAELLRNALDTIYKALTFPFNLTYFDFNSDQNQSDITITIFPEDFSLTLSDIDFYDCLFNLVTAGNLEIKLSALRILSRISSTRLSIFEEPIKDLFKGKFIMGFSILVKNSPLDNQEFSVEIVEYALRIIFVFGFNSVKNSPFFADFLMAAKEYCLATLKICTQIDNPLFYRLVEFWNKLETTISSSDIESRSSFLLEAVTNYCNIQIVSNPTSNFFVENVKSVKKFQKSVNQRFEFFKEFSRKNTEKAINLYSDVAARLMAENGQLQSGQIDLNIYITQVGHFMLMFAKSFFKVDLPNLNFQRYLEEYELEDSESESSSMLKMRLVEITVFLLNTIKATRGMAANMRRDILIGYEMSSLFFLETFLTSAIDNNKAAEDGTHLQLTDMLTSQTLQQLQIGTFAQFFDTTTDKILGNLEYRVVPISEHSIAVLRVLIEKIKKVFKGKSRSNPLIDNFTSKLQGINFSVLSERQFYKLRSRLFETISIGYLDDSFDDYVNNSHTILERILFSNTADGVVDLMKVFFDIIGIYKAISLSKIIIVFSKICYPKIQELIHTQGMARLRDPEFLVALLDLYNVLIENTSQKYSAAQAHVVMYQIITDACQILVILLKDINAALESLTSPGDILKFLEANLKVVKKLFRIFKSMLKYSDLSFSIFHFFGYMTFLDLLQGIHKFMFLTADHIVRHFPDKSELFLECFKESCTNLSDFMVEHFSAQELARCFSVLHIFFVKKVEEALESTETNSLQDEAAIQIISAIVNQLSLSLYEAACICRNDQKVIQKIQQTASLAIPTINDFSLKLIELCVKINYSAHVNNLVADIFFNFVAVFGVNEILPQLIQRIQIDLRLGQGMVEMAQFSLALEELQKDIQFRLELSQKEKFHDRFREFIKVLCKLGSNNG